MLEGDAIGSPLLGAELRGLLTELRARPHPYDALSLAFMIGDGYTKKNRGNYADRAPKDSYISPRAYMLTASGASKLCRQWQQYENVDSLMMGELKAEALTLLVPGDGRPVVHLTQSEKLAFKAGNKGVVGSRR